MSDLHPSIGIKLEGNVIEGRERRGYRGRHTCPTALQPATGSLQGIRERLQICPSAAHLQRMSWLILVAVQRLALVFHRYAPQ